MRILAESDHSIWKGKLISEFGCSSDFVSSQSLDPKEIYDRIINVKNLDPALYGLLCDQLRANKAYPPFFSSQLPSSRIGKVLAGHYLKHAVALGNLPLVQWLTSHERGDDKLSLETDDLKTHLRVAIKSGYLPLVQWILQELGGPSSIQVDSEIYGAVALSNKIDLVSWLFSQGLPNSRVLKTMLDTAASSGKLEMVQWLLDEARKDLNVELDDNTYTVAAKSNNTDLVSYLFSQNEPCPKTLKKMLDCAAKLGNLAMVMWLLDPARKGQSIDADNKTFKAAALSNNTDLVGWLVLLKHPDQSTLKMMLDAAALGGKLKMVQWVMGGWVSDPVKPNDTTYKQAALSNNVALVEWLFSNAENPRAETLKSIFEEAVRKDNFAMVQWLVAVARNELRIIPDEATLAACRKAGNERVINWLEKEFKIEKKADDVKDGEPEKKGKGGILVDELKHAFQNVQNGLNADSNPALVNNQPSPSNVAGNESKPSLPKPAGNQVGEPDPNRDAEDVRLSQHDVDASQKSPTTAKDNSETTASSVRIDIRGILIEAECELAIIRQASQTHAIKDTSAQSNRNKLIFAITTVILVAAVAALVVTFPPVGVPVAGFLGLTALLTTTLGVTAFGATVGAMTLLAGAAITGLGIVAAKVGSGIKQWFAPRRRYVVIDDEEQQPLASASVTERCNTGAIQHALENGTDSTRVPASQQSLSSTVSSVATTSHGEDEETIVYTPASSTASSFSLPEGAPLLSGGSSRTYSDSPLSHRGLVRCNDASDEKAVAENLPKTEAVFS